MALINPIKRLTATVPLEYRPEDTVWVKIQFLQEDEITPYDMSSYNLELSVYAPTVATSILNKIPDGTEQGKTVVAFRQSRDNEGNQLTPDESGIYLEDAEESIYTIQYGKEEGVVFLIGEYTMNLSARLQHGQWKSILSFKVRFHNDIVETGEAVSNASFIKLPITRTETTTILLPIQNVL